jgi:hypothetical protein
MLSLIDIPLPDSPISNTAVQGISQAHLPVDPPINAQPAQAAVEPTMQPLSLLNILAMSQFAGAVLFFA